MNTLPSNDLENFRQFIDHKLNNGNAHLSPEQLLQLYREQQAELDLDMDDEIPYQAPAAKAVKTKRVKFRPVGKGKPLHYEIDEQALDIPQHNE